MQERIARRHRIKDSMHKDVVKEELRLEAYQIADLINA